MRACRRRSRAIGRASTPRWIPATSTSNRPRSPAASSPRPTPISARAARNVGLIQTVYNGQRTGSLTRQAESAVLAGRETLRNSRADHAARCRDPVHERAARHRDPRSAAAQRGGAAGTAETDARSLQCRRGDAHRRGAIRVARRGVAIAGAGRGSQSEGIAGGLPARGRRGAGQPASRNAGRPPLPADARGLDRQRPRQAPVGHLRAIHRRHRAILP